MLIFLDSLLALSKAAAVLDTAFTAPSPVFDIPEAKELRGCLATTSAEVSEAAV